MGKISVIIWGVYKTLFESAVWKYQYGSNLNDVRVSNYIYWKLLYLVSA